MNIALVKFLAEQRAEIDTPSIKADFDWQAVGHNENPYSPMNDFEAYTAYNNRFEQIREEWEGFTRSAA